MRRLALLVVLGCLLANPVLAGERVQIKITKAIRASGYTLELNQLKLGLPAGSIKKSARVWLREKNHAVTLPEYLTRVSPDFVFNIKAKLPQPLNKALWITYSLTNVPTQRTGFYVYDYVQQTWEPLATTYRFDTKTLEAVINNSAVTFAVLTDTRFSFGPVAKTNWQAFGDINAVSAVALDDATGNILYEKNSNSVRSIASLTKLMTAYVVLNNNVDLNKIVTYHDDYDRIGGMLYVHEGETMTLENLMNAMVVGSANNAAIALVNQAGYKEADFIGLMNEQAKTLGLANTSFADPSGLEVNNLSTAYEYAQFLRTALNNEQLTKFSTTGYYSFSTINTEQFHDFNNTNPLLRTSALDITGSKTGYIDEALYCLALKAKAGDHEVITVVLGVSSSSVRFSESERLMQWALDNYEWAE
ncbi:MAG: serine hydrolase [Patescibacteria group bacterium]|jgi:D-alanyl-D-alanine carboxypeptidase